MLKLRYLVIFTSLMVALHAHSAKAESSQVKESKEVQFVLDDFHDAADKGDKDRYLGHFTDQGVFLGTDDWERWPLDEFTKYVSERFKDGKGWSYKPESRNIMFDPTGTLAWFDEITVSEKWGRFRGAGVLRKVGDEWKIETYAMSVIVPNEAWEKVSEINKAKFAERAKKNAEK